MLSSCLPAMNAKSRFAFAVTDANTCCAAVSESIVPAAAGPVSAPFPRLAGPPPCAADSDERSTCGSSASYGSSVVASCQSQLKARAPNTAAASASSVVLTGDFRVVASADVHNNGALMWSMDAMR